MFWKTDEAEVERTEHRYRQLVEQLDMPLLVHREGVILFATQATAEMLAASDVTEVMGRAIVDFIHPDDLDRVIREMSRVIGGEPVARDRYRVVRLDGETIWLEAAATPIMLEGEEATLVAAEDVTARVEAECALRSSESRYRALVQNSSEIVAVLDGDGTLAYVSPATATVLGRSPEELLGRKVSDLLHPEDLEGFHARLEALVSGPCGHSAIATYRAGHRDGKWRHLEVVATSQLGEPAVGGIVVNARDVTDRVAADADLRRLALHDPLTGLANRTLIEERTRQAVAGATGGRRAALIAIDLDHFKDINDSLGHGTGDIVLSEIAHRIERAVRSGDTVGRLGGDEFLVVLPDLDRMLDASATARRIAAEIEAPVEHQGQRFRLTASVGIALAPDHGVSTDLLLRAADAAMYRAKRGHNGPAVFNERDHEYSVERLSLSTELADAVEHDEFELHYQPKYELSGGTLTGVEALLRWSHPRHGLICPGDFLPLAEDTGLIHPITSWVLDTAINQAAAWREQGLDLSVAVNLSPSSLQDPDFAAEVIERLDAHQLPPERLLLEVTEQTIMANPEAALKVMDRLTQAGIGFSIDDFGTGYSSLTYLRLLPVGELKIDRSFISDSNGEIDRDIVETIIALSQRLGLRVVAEGIESDVATEYLRARGCHVGQGFLLGRPVPADRLDINRRLASPEVEAVRVTAS